MTTFMSDNDFINIIKSNTCFKMSTGTCIDLLLTYAKKLSEYRSDRNRCQRPPPAHILNFKNLLHKNAIKKLRYRKYKSFDKMKVFKGYFKLT